MVKVKGVEFIITKCTRQKRRKGKMKKTKMLKKNYEFKKVLSKGKHYSSKNIDMVVLKNSKNYNLLGLAISTKIGKAVKRNMIKRLIRENYKNLESQIKEGNSIIFLWKKSSNTKNATYQNIEKDMKELLDKAKLI
jgi:ribonuclease P protein component